jgi:hypothetical protein
VELKRGRGVVEQFEPHLLGHVRAVEPRP